MKTRPVEPTRMWKVMARVHDGRDDEPQLRWMLVRSRMARGAAEAVMVQITRDGFRLDGEHEMSGSVFYPPHRIWLAEVVPDDLEVKP